MPNVIIEVSHDHLISQPANLLARVNDTLWQSGNFKLQSDIKSRIYYPNHVLVGLTDSGAPRPKGHGVKRPTINARLQPQVREHLPGPYQPPLEAVPRRPHDGATVEPRGQAPIRAAARISAARRP